MKRRVVPDKGSTGGGAPQSNGERTPAPAAQVPVPSPARCRVLVDSDGFVFVRGVKVARAVRREGDVLLQFIDKDCRRADRRGRYVEIAVQELATALHLGPVVLDSEDPV